LAYTEMRRSRVQVAAAGLCVGLLLLWLRLGWLQVVQHERYQRRADGIGVRVLVKPVRGSLLDRAGRPLAHDLLTYAVSVAPREMAKPRATAHALAQLLGQDPRQLERDFAARPRYLSVARGVAPDIGQRIAARADTGVYLALETRREYLLGPAACEILGRTSVDNEGLEGLELQFDEELRGRPGWTTLFRAGRWRSYELPRGMRRSPEDGDNLVLTLDADLQSIVENHLARAVDTLKAARGFALFLDPQTGEVLAAVNVPHMPAGKARNWTFTDQYEPGSTYKVVVAGTALEEQLVQPDEYFEAAANGEARIAPGKPFRDEHKEAGFTFRDAVRWSSNIVMGKIGLQIVGAERIYRYSEALGFGSVTGVSFPGESPGKLPASPSQWPKRSTACIAIGQGVAVTPLQLTLAYAAVANGGVLMEPMLVREVRDAQGALKRRYSPHAVRRVFRESTTRLLREMLTAVVDSGTARAACVPSLRIAGKTGTAQKYDPETRSYSNDRYVASFAGFAPADGPRLVGVVVIDEPHGGQHHYGGLYAAPVFREVMLDLQRLPHGPLEPGLSQVAARPPAPAPVTVPDLRLLPPAVAERKLAGFGLRALFIGHGPRVLAQSPGAGEAAERGAPVQVWLAAPADSLGRVMPDLVGLPRRDALRRLTLHQAVVRIEGRGMVVRQEPPAGAALAPGTACLLWCAPGMGTAAPGRSALMVAGSGVP
jgi:cell division protein FtsI/penicillin-binding protein 2